MSILVAREETYEFDKASITKLIAADLNVPEEKVKVEFVIEDTADDRFSGGYNHYEVTSIRVRVDKK
jgi:hypothetical protein